MNSRPETPVLREGENRTSGRIGRSSHSTRARPSGATGSRIPALLFLFAIMLHATGCQQLLHELGYYRVLHKHRAWMAWIDSEDFGSDPDARCHFGRGWRRGYADVAGGGDGLPPIISPQCYWGKRNGERKAESWFEGYHFGALAAEVHGVYAMNFVPTSPAAAPLYADFPAEVIPTIEGFQSNHIRALSEASSGIEVVGFEAEQRPKVDDSSFHRAADSSRSSRLPDGSDLHTVPEAGILLAPARTESAESAEEVAAPTDSAAEVDGSEPALVRTRSERTDGFEASHDSAAGKTLAQRLADASARPVTGSEDPATRPAIETDTSQLKPPPAHAATTLGRDKRDAPDTRDLAQKLYDEYAATQKKRWQEQQVPPVGPSLERSTQSREVEKSDDLDTRDLVKELYAQYAEVQKQRWQQRQSRRPNEALGNPSSKASSTHQATSALEVSDTHELVQTLYEEYADAHKKLWQQQRKQQSSQSRATQFSRFRRRGIRLWRPRAILISQDHCEVAGLV